MKFEVLPVLEDMLQLYRLPPDRARFERYLALLQGGTAGDLAKPLGGFNPMAKEHVLQHLHQMQELRIENRMADVLEQLNREAAPGDPLVQVAFNLSDDLRGGWTNRYISDYQSKFRLGALLKRRFCVPVFWTSEVVTAQTIVDRTREYCIRTRVVAAHGQPHTLREHLQQELEVARRVFAGAVPGAYSPQCDEVYPQHWEASEEALLVDLLYGDPAARELGHALPGLPAAFAGFAYVRGLAALGRELP